MKDLTRRLTGKISDVRCAEASKRVRVMKGAFPPSTDHSGEEAPFKMWVFERELWSFESLGRV